MQQENAAMNMNSPCWALAAFLCFASMSVQAADFDGSKVLICATIEAHECDPGENCLRSLPAELGAPQFLRIDVAKKTILGPVRTTSIRFVDTGPAQTLLQGDEFGYAWTIALDSATGSFTLTLVNYEESLVLFGACTPL
jgi:hypothetical protein